MNDQWINKLRDRLINYKKAAPEGLWNDIEKHMIEKDITTSPKFQIKKAFLWTGCISTIAALFIFVFFIIKQNNFNLSTSFKPLTLKETHLSLKQELTQLENKNININTIHLKKYYKKSHKKMKVQIHCLTKLPYDTISPKKLNGRHKIKREGISGEETKNKAYFNIASTPPYNNKSKKLTADFYISNLPNATVTEHKYAGLSFCSTPPESIPEDAKWGEDPMIDILLYNQGKNIQTKVKHEQPIRIGLNLRYNLNERFSLKGGITYSKLVSHLSSGSDKYRYETDQTLHFIGIPVGINYHFLQSKYLEVYVSGGGMVEKCISGSSITNYIFNNQVTFGEKENVKVNPLQWSINTSAGIQYNITSQIGLYTEPGFNYYLKNGSQVHTIYREKPLNFNLEIGLRFSIK